MHLAADCTFLRLALQTAHKYGDSPAFTDGLSGRTIKYSELGQRVGGAAEALAAMGFGDKDVLNIHLPNTPEYCIAFNAAAALGGVASTSNPMYTTEELHRQLVDSGAKVLLTAEPFKAMAEAAAEGTKVQRIVLAGSKDDFTFAPGVEFQGTVQRVWDDPAAATVAMPYSSGTTGPPKGTMLVRCHGSFLAAARAHMPRFPCTEPPEPDQQCEPDFRPSGVQLEHAPG